MVTVPPRDEAVLSIRTCAEALGLTIGFGMPMREVGLLYTLTVDAQITFRVWFGMHTAPLLDSTKKICKVQNNIDILRHMEQTLPMNLHPT